MKMTPQGRLLRRDKTVPVPVVEKTLPVDFYSNFLSPEEADRLLEASKALEWQHNDFALYGKTMPLPRLETMLGDVEGLTYRYGKVVLTAKPWTSDLQALRERIEAYTGYSFQVGIGNWYRSGSDHIGPHSDDSPEMGENPAIASISLGGTRRFGLRNLKTNEIHHFDLTHGSLIVMHPGCQRDYKHWIAKTKKAVDLRINWTFRPHLGSTGNTLIELPNVVETTDSVNQTLEPPPQTVLGEASQKEQRKPKRGTQPKFKERQRVQVNCPHRVGKDFPDMHGLIGIVDGVKVDAGRIQYKLPAAHPQERRGIYYVPEVWLEYAPHKFAEGDFIRHPKHFEHVVQIAQILPPLEPDRGLREYLVYSFPTASLLKNEWVRIPEYDAYAATEPDWWSLTVGDRVIHCHGGSPGTIIRIRTGIAWVKPEVGQIKLGFVEEDPLDRGERFLHQLRPFDLPYKIGDRLRQDLNKPEWGKRLDSMVCEGVILSFKPQGSGFAPWMRWDDGTEGWGILEHLQIVESSEPAEEANHSLQIGDRVAGQICLYGQYRLFIGAVLVAELPAAVQVEWSAEVDGKIHRGVMQIPVAQLRKLDEQAPELCCLLPRFRDVIVPFQRPLERESEQAEITHDAIARLELEKQQLLSEGSAAPDGCWIETGRVKGKEFRQAWWRSTKAMFTAKRSRGNVEALVKTQYIGKEGSEEHKAAIAARQRRERLKQIEKQIEILSKEAG